MEENMNEKEMNGKQETTVATPKKRSKVFLIVLILLVIGGIFIVRRAKAR